MKNKESVTKEQIDKHYCAIIDSSGEFVRNIYGAPMLFKSVTQLSSIRIKAEHKGLPPFSIVHLRLDKDSIKLWEVANGSFSPKIPEYSQQEKCDLESLL